MNRGNLPLQTVTGLIEAARTFDLDALELCTHKLEAEVRSMKQFSSVELTPEFKIAVRRCQLLLTGSIRWLSILQRLQELKSTSVQQQHSSVIA